jgi:hypothetical protein
LSICSITHLIAIGHPTAVLFYSFRAHDYNDKKAELTQGFSLRQPGNIYKRPVIFHLLLKEGFGFNIGLYVKLTFTMNCLYCQAEKTK